MGLVMKHCKKCDKDKNESEFYLHRAECKSCKYAAQKANLKIKRVRERVNERHKITNYNVVRAAGDESDWEDACA